jgi:hypothetical protein
LNVLLAFTDHRMVWAIHKSDPSTTALEVGLEWSFVNPLLYFGMKEALSLSDRDLTIYGIHDERTILQTHCLVLSIPDDVLRERTPVAVIDIVAHLIASLRHLSKQWGLSGSSDSIQAVRLRAVSKMPVPNYPATSLNSHAWVRRHIVDTAITWEHIAFAAKTLHAFNLIPSSDFYQVATMEEGSGSWK